jgi:hypothetical protein
MMHEAMMQRMLLHEGIMLHEGRMLHEGVILHEEHAMPGNSAAYKDNAAH